ncbi:hypothetical protein DFH07DRAFT_316960 [Mycena maculata]|uniref:Uncharacterized protein n=1 Tax=Mycena maculata TaxID=230809 RepID=A0AAD7HFM2_9AGAR|nr:hypothetical protein DFH07DRAFT_316960 [Mycena maculata]
MALPLPACLGRKASYKIIVFGLLSFLVLSGFGYRTLHTQSPLEYLYPVDYTPPPAHIFDLGHPTFADIRQYERALPQHRMPTFLMKNRPRYVYFPNEAWGTGWNNVFQEQLLNTHLAYLSNRGYVFVDYIARDHPPFPDTLPDGTRHMLHIPMNALTSGPTGGGSLGQGADPKSVRAVSLEWWDAVCPSEQVVEVPVGETVQELNITDASAGEERLVRWAGKLRSIEAECVKVVGGSPFDYMFIGGDKVLSMWPSYGNSPTVKEYAWSALVTRAISRNFALLSSEALPPSLSPSLSRITTTPGAGNTSSPYPLAAFSPLRTSGPPIDGLMALHVRRGDYADHCKNLAGWGVDYNAWNTFGRPDMRATGRYPPLPDYLSVPGGVERYDASYRHCWPTAEQIVERVRAVRAVSESGESFPAQYLRAVYIATNGEAEWVNALAELLKRDGWETVSSSLDMGLAQDEFAVSQAVDMGVLTSAETFIGVGFSSLTSNVVQLRLGGGRHPDTNRFW